MLPWPNLRTTNPKPQKHIPREQIRAAFLWLFFYEITPLSRRLSLKESRMVQALKRARTSMNGDSSPTQSVMSDCLVASDSKDSIDGSAIAVAQPEACSLTFIPACFVCKMLFEEGRPIFQCGTIRHLACVNCWKVASRPWCDCTPQSSSRSTTLESLVLPAITAPCSNSMHGCRKILSYYSRAAHERDECEFGPVACTVSACNFSAAPQGFLAHLREIHGSSLIETVDGKRLQLSLSIAATVTPIRVSFGGRSVVCLLHQELLDQTDMSAFYMTILGPAPEDVKLIYEIAIGRPPSSIDCMNLRSMLVSHRAAAIASLPPLRLYACHGQFTSDCIKIILCVRSAAAAAISAATSSAAK